MNTFKKIMRPVIVHSLACELALQQNFLRLKLRAKRARTERGHARLAWLPNISFSRFSHSLARGSCSQAITATEWLKATENNNTVIFNVASFIKSFPVDHFHDNV